MNAIYFQPPGINPKYCEVGMILDTDPEHISYLDEPCKILISEVKIIDKKNVFYNKKNRLCYVNITSVEEKERGIIITSVEEKMYSMEDMWKARTFFTKNDIEIGGYTDGYLKLKFINWIKENLS